MKVEILSGDNLVGIGELEGLDPPMGVAFGTFSPSDRYDRNEHANSVEGSYVDDKGRSLSVRTDRLGLLKATSIAVEDWADPEIGKQLTIWFENGRDFAPLFSEHEDFKAYYAQ